MEVLNIRPMTVIRTTSLLATAGILAWSASYVAGLIWHLLATDVNVSATETLVGNNTSVADKRMLDTVDLQRLQSVFVLQAQGQRAVVDADSDVEVSAEQTRLSLTLQGVVVSSDAAQSRAIIGSGEAQQGYKPGDSIAEMPGNVVLQAVYQRYVLLNNNGRTETLRMDEAPAEDARTGSQAMSALADVTAPAANPTPGSGIAPAGPGQFAGKAFADLVRILPVVEPADSPQAGALRGLQIRHGSRQDFLSAVGLQQGDLITGVNGTPLQDAAQLPQLLQQISDSPTVALQIVRDEQQIYVQLDRAQW
jgi:general secretion pathway protein C